MWIAGAVSSIVARVSSREDETAARLAAIVQSSDDAIVSKTLEGVVVSWNPAAERIFGWTSAEIVGRSIRLIIPADRQGEEDEVLRRVGRGEAVEHFETIRVRKSGEPVHISLTVSPVRAPDGAIIGVSKIARDITAQKRLEAERELLLARAQKARSLAEAASRAKDEFLSTLSHELRTPLQAILGWAHVLRAKNVSAERREQAVATIERNARAQTRLVEGLLDLSRIEQGKFVLSVGPLELVRVVEGALDSMRPAAEAKSITIQPVLDSHATIVGDADRLQQVIWNLLSNAIKFTPKGGRVQVRLRRDASYVEVVVADNGKGIDASFLPHVFERFRQADGSNTRQEGGLGLGLSIARALVELHGGTISAASDGPGLGATFTVRLPMAPLRADRFTPPPAGTEPDEAPARETFECPPPLAGLRVLVVDDEADTRALLGYLLEQCDAVVTPAAGVAEAMAALRDGSFDVLISDVGMPGEDGFALIRQVRALPDPAGRIPALALTAYARSEDRTRALRAGFSMHLPKPVEADELLVVVAHLAQKLPTTRR